jgi:hypothetical protein
MYFLYRWRPVDHQLGNIGYIVILKAVLSNRSDVSADLLMRGCILAVLGKELCILKTFNQRTLFRVSCLTVPHIAGLHQNFCAGIWGNTSQVEAADKTERVISPINYPAWVPQADQTGYCDSDFSIFLESFHKNFCMTPWNWTQAMFIKPFPAHRTLHK